MLSQERVFKYLMAYIAGNIVASEDPGRAIREWREFFKIKQVELARRMGVSSPVISDYERGRRSPGLKVIRNIVRSILEIDKERGFEVSRKLMLTIPTETEAIIDMKDFTRPLPIESIVKNIEGEVLYGEHLLERPVFGYTIIHSIKAILSMSGYDFFKLMGLTSARIAAFTHVGQGRSPMIAVRVYPVKPFCVVLHGPKKIEDPLVFELAKLEEIPLILSRLPTIKELVEGFRKAVAEM